MKFIIALFFVVIAGPACAASLTVDQVIGIGNALNQLQCFNRIIKDGAKETIVCDPYKFKAGISWVIARNLQKAQDVAKQFDRLREIELTKGDRKEDGSLKENSVAVINVTLRTLLDAPSKVEMEKLQQSDLESMGIPPQILSPLLPIIE